MKRFLITSHIDGRNEVLPKLQSLVRDRQPHGVLFAGGILGSNPASPAEKLKRWENFFDGLGKLGVFTAVVPGAAEVPLREFLRAAKAAEIAHPNVRVVHAGVFEEKGLAIGGLGGELTEAEDHTEDRLCYARASAEYFLRAFWRAEQPSHTLLLSVPPPGQLIGEIGNRICGDFIDSYHPTVCAVAGSTDRCGCQRVAHTLVVNPGRLADGSVAWLDRDRGTCDQVEFLRL